MKKGLACDIDDTLSETKRLLFQRLMENFGNPENLTVEGMIAKYTYTFNVPYFQTPEVVDYSRRLINSPKFYRDLEKIEGAKEGLDAIADHIASYMTMRPEKVKGSTYYWLGKHEFPFAKVIAKPNNIPLEKALQWKANQLLTSRDNVGIIEDNAGILEKLKQFYKGTIILYDHSEVPNPNGLKVIPAPTWDDVVDIVKQEF